MLLRSWNIFQFSRKNTFPNFICETKVLCFVLFCFLVRSLLLREKNEYNFWSCSFFLYFFLSHFHSFLSSLCKLLWLKTPNRKAEGGALVSAFQRPRLNGYWLTVPTVLWCSSRREYHRCWFLYLYITLQSWKHRLSHLKFSCLFALGFCARAETPKPSVPPLLPVLLVLQSIVVLL